MNRLALRLALLLTGLAHRLLPAHQRDWGAAMLGEVVTIAEGRHALAFAIGYCLSLLALAAPRGSRLPQEGFAPRHSEPDGGDSQLRLALR